MHIQPLERLMTSVQIRKAQTLWAQVYLPRRVLQYLRHNGFGSEQIPASFLHLFLSWPRRVHFGAPSWLSPKSLFNPIVQVTKRSAEALRCARPFSAQGCPPAVAWRNSCLVAQLTNSRGAQHSAAWGRQHCDTQTASVPFRTRGENSDSNSHAAIPSLPRDCFTDYLWR